jgi:hypothetical protein
MKQEKEPLWREQFKQPQSLHGRYRQRVDIPTYLRRWLVVHGNRHPDRLVPDILEQAMLLYFGCMYRPPSYAGHPGRDYLNNLLAGRYVDGNEEQICGDLLAGIDDALVAEQYGVLNAAVVICVSNGSYGYFFCVEGLRPIGRIVSNRVRRRDLS